MLNLAADALWIPIAPSTPAWSNHPLRRVGAGTHFETRSVARGRRRGLAARAGLKFSGFVTTAPRSFFRLGICSLFQSVPGLALGMATNPGLVRAGVYCRISDRAGGGLGVERQRKDCARLAAKLGWRLIDTYTDNDISAYSGRRRPEYERLLTDLTSGRIDAVVTWHLDRLNRSPVELERLIPLLERHGVQVQTATAARAISPTEARLAARSSLAKSASASSPGTADCA